MADSEHVTCILFHFQNLNSYPDASKNRAFAKCVPQRRDRLLSLFPSKFSLKFSVPEARHFVLTPQLITVHARTKRKFPVSFVRPFPGWIIGKIFIDPLDGAEIMTRAIPGNSSLPRRLITTMYGTLARIL